MAASFQNASRSRAGTGWVSPAPVVRVRAYDRRVSEPAAVLLVVTGVLLAVAALLLALAATLAWAVRVPAVGGVAGRAGPGWLYRDRDDLVSSAVADAS
jgi:hypothetical protein